MNLNTLPSRTVAQRMEYFRSRLPSMRLDAYWVVDPADVRYLSGFTGEESTLLVTRDWSGLITDSRFEEQAGAEALVDEIVLRQKGMAATVGLLSRRMGLRRIAFTSRHLAYADWQALSSELVQARLVPCGEGLPERMRARKSREEAKAIALAVRLAERAFLRFVQQVQPGRTERWLAGRLEWEMVVAGAERAAFDTICAVGERASLPHAVCTERQVGPDGVVLVDWGARVGGYHSDLTRIVGTGTMPRRVRELAQVVLEAQEAALEKLAPGVSCGEVDRAARTVVARAGYGPNFGHSVGHGVGLTVHEAPRLAAGEVDVLLPGMVVTVEPGIYVPGEGGVRIEDVVVVTDGGCEVLSSLEREPGCRMDGPRGAGDGSGSCSGTG